MVDDVTCPWDVVKAMRVAESSTGSERPSTYVKSCFPMWFTQYETQLDPEQIIPFEEGS